MGNKGAIVINMEIKNTKVTIINCHLAAGENKLNERLQDLDQIHHGAIKERNKRRFFDRSEFRFLIGDMNFRVDMKC